MAQKTAYPDLKTIENLQKLTEKALGLLKKERDQLVLAKRHGIKDFDSHTLEQIGKELGITRERVRQIEKAALGKIREQSEHDNELSAQVKSNLETIGGLIAFENLLKNLNFTKDEINNLSFLIKLDPRFLLLEKTDHYGGVVIDVDIYSDKDIEELHDQLITIVKTYGKPVKFEAIVKKIDGPHQSEALFELAKASRVLTELDKNWGLTHWPEVNPKSIRDKIYLVLKKSSKPMHFTQIAKKVEQLKANPKKVTTQAVHNELIKDPRFILIGRGIYALKEWGYEAGTVADIIELILKEKSPLTKDEIVKRVLEKRKVKVTTILLNLQEKSQFEKVGKATYRLKDR